MWLLMPKYNKISSEKPPLPLNPELQSSSSFLNYEFAFRPSSLHILPQLISKLIQFRNSGFGSNSRFQFHINKKSGDQRSSCRCAESVERNKSFFATKHLFHFQNLPLFFTERWFLVVPILYALGHALNSPPCPHRRSQMKACQVMLLEDRRVGVYVVREAGKLLWGTRTKYNFKFSKICWIALNEKNKLIHFSIFKTVLLKKLFKGF